MRIALTARLIGLLLLACLATTQALAQTSGILPPDWVQLGTRGLDASVGDDGQPARAQLHPVGWQDAAGLCQGLGCGEARQQQKTNESGGQGDSHGSVLIAR